MTTKIGTLVTYPNYYRGQKALIVGALSNAHFDVQQVEENAAAAAAAAASSSSSFSERVPLLRLNVAAEAEDDVDDAVIFDVNAICFRLADESLRGRSVAETTDVLEWLYFADHELLPPVCAWVFPLIGVLTSEAGKVAKAKEDCLRILKVLDDHLLFRTFLTGHRVTLADVSVFCNLLFLYKHVLSPSVRRPFVCLNRWFKTLQGRKEFRDQVGDFAWCEAEAKLED